MSRRHDDISSRSRVSEDATIIGQNIRISAEHKQKILETEQHEKEIKTMRDYRNRIQKVCNFIRSKYRSYVSVGGVVKLSRQLKSNPVFFAWKSKDDLKYTGLNINIIKAFLGQIKIKENGNTCSHVHVRKYHDAILWGSEKAKQPLPPDYLREMPKYLDSFKKETRKAKQEGMLDEEEAEPIPFALYIKICEWAILAKSTYVWVFTVFQWNCLARSINIDPLALHNFTPGSDSIKVKYDETKKDKRGVNCTHKNIFANPHDPRISFHLALACWMCLESDRFNVTEKLFLSEGAKVGCASHIYSSQLSTLLKDKTEQVR